MNPALAVVAAANGGIFTFSEAITAGYTKPQIAYRIDTGRWLRLRRGTYRLAEGSVATPEVVAAWQRRIGGGVAAHETAALIHGLSVFWVPPVVTLVRPSGRRGIRSYDGLRLTAARLPDDHITTVGGVLVTTPERTVVDIARHRGFRSGVVVADSALRLGLVTRQQLQHVIDDCRGFPRIKRAGIACEFADGRSESVLESLGRVAFHDWQLPAPQLQFWVADDIRVDFYWSKQRVVGEADGLLKYDEDVNGRSLRDEKLRQERIERMGLAVVRYTYWDITRDARKTEDRFRFALNR
jgi:putative AbiEi antitoxin of type IV toxin-antitoxin system/transcriptional regulator with AbiEi antitoxin domain of type IV toxin-antitoxin system